jgi:hypothetical protein
MKTTTMTTERILPAIAVPAPVRPHPHRLAPTPLAPTPLAPTPLAPIPGIRQGRPTVRRREAVLSTPTRAGMLIGASAAIYAATLTGVSALQSQANATLVARNAPYAEALAASRAANDSLEQALLAANTEVQALADSYARVGTDVTAYQARLDELAVLVADIQGSVAALPTRISLPGVHIRGAIAGSGGGGSKAPASTASSGASGAP